MTKKEYENTIEIKLLKTYLKSEFPWILDVSAPDELSIYSANFIFIDLTINPYLLKNLYDWDLETYVVFFASRDDLRGYAYLATIFIKDSEDSPSKLQNYLERKINFFYTAMSKNIPIEMRNEIFLNKKYQTILINRFHVPPKSVLPIPENIEIKNNF